MRFIVCGDREGFDVRKMWTVLAALPDGSVIIHGDCRGVDRDAGTMGKLLGFKVCPMPADWARYRAGAGPIRNQQMLDVGGPNEVIAFHANLDKSKGTLDMISKASEAGLVVRHFR